MADDQSSAPDDAPEPDPNAAPEVASVPEPAPVTAQVAPEAALNHLAAIADGIASGFLHLVDMLPSAQPLGFIARDIRARVQQIREMLNHS